MPNFDIYKRGAFVFAPDEGAGGGAPAAGADSGEITFHAPDEAGAAAPYDPLHDEGFVLEDEPKLFDAPGSEGAQVPGDQVPGAEGSQASAFEVKDGKLVFGEDSLSPEELKDFLDKGKDYTRKTQELASQRAAIAPAIEFTKFVDALPPAAVEELALVARRIDQGVKSGTYVPGGSPAAQPALPSDPNAPFEIGGVKIDPKDFDDGGKLLIAALRHSITQNAQLAQAFNHVNGQLGEVKKTLPQVQSALQSVQGDKDAAAAAAKIKSDWGATVDPAQLRQLSQQTGIPDMEAAWLKANGAEIRKGAFNQGHAQGTRPKPKTPAGGAKVFDPNDPGMTTDGVMRALAAGATPMPGAGVKK